MTSAIEIESLIGRYREWLKDRTAIKMLHNEWVEITTPYLDRHNDAIQLYVRKETDRFRLTDDGNTLRDLELSGCLINTPKRRSLLDIAIRGFAVDIKNDVLSVTTAAENFPARKHALIQSILAVNDLFYTASSTVRSLFREDVEAWLNSSDVRFLKSVQFLGKTGYAHNFDFAVPPSRVAPERIIKAISNPNKESAESVIFSWLDTRDVRPSDSQALAVLNDQDSQIPAAVMDALREYDIKPVPWSSRSNSREQLAA